jgi:signal transduction histidine kinase
MSSEALKIEKSSGFTPVPIVEVIPDMARKIAQAHKRAEDLVLNLCDASILVPAENLAKITEELIDNAFKFSEPGRPVKVVGAESNHEFHLTITDQGRGMTSENIANVGPHMQFEREIYEQQGSGLGLIIAKRLTELLGGKFLITSQPLKGTSVRVSFAMPGC